MTEILNIISILSMSTIAFMVIILWTLWVLYVAMMSIDRAMETMTLPWQAKLLVCPTRFVIRFCGVAG